MPGSATAPHSGGARPPAPFTTCALTTLPARTYRSCICVLKWVGLCKYDRKAMQPYNHASLHCIRAPMHACCVCKQGICNTQRICMDACMRTDGRRDGCMDGGTDGLMDGWVDIISCSMCIHRIRNLYTHIYIYIIIHIHIYIHIYVYTICIHTRKRHLYE